MHLNESNAVVAMMNSNPAASGSGSKPSNGEGAEAGEAFPLKANGSKNSTLEKKQEPETFNHTESKNVHNPELSVMSNNSTMAAAGPTASTPTHRAQAPGSSRNSLCLPLLFERAAPSWWHLQFDSAILENQYRISTQPRTTRRFQFGLLYLFILSVLLAIYFPSMKTQHWPTVLGLSLAVCCLVVFVLFLTTTQLYKRHYSKISLILALFLCTMSLLASTRVKSSLLDRTSYIQNDISPAGMFAIYLAIVVLLYTAIPLPLYATVLVGVTYSVLFEVVLSSALPERVGDNQTLAINVLLHVCIHVLGMHSLITWQVRMRDTFMKVGQSLMVKKQLGNEKGLKEKMIHSVMPPKVADWLMKEGNTEGEYGDDVTNDAKSMDSNDLSGIESESMVRKISSPRSSNQGDIRTIFRPFNMNAMDNVSILFADIVGFTKMSSNKTASQLVGLLNDLFGRFDYLCNKCGCEKISTLGDCYYCVSGCPEPKPDHARNCVEMGLAMISAIKDFDEDRHESVNMRVGIHTGTVLCGIVGKRRFKFDVWSNDVTLANKMESTGKPGMVHISEKTHAFLNDEYFVQEGDMVKDMRTYFITGRANANYVPLDTRMARRTSSTPATFLLPSITKTDVSTNQNNVITQSLPSIPSTAPSLPLGNCANPAGVVNGSRPTESNSAQPLSSLQSSTSAFIRRLSWKNGKRVLNRSESQKASSQNQNHQQMQRASTTVTMTPASVTGGGRGGVTVGLTSRKKGGSFQKAATKSKSNPLSNESLSRHCESEPPTMLSNSEDDALGLDRVQAFAGNHQLQYKDLNRRRLSNSDPTLKTSILASATGGRELLTSAGLSIDDDDCKTPCLPRSESSTGTERTKPYSDSPAGGPGASSGPPGNPGSGGHAPSSSGAPPNPNNNAPVQNGSNSMTQLRLATDRAMISCVKEDAGHHAYFSKPPLQEFTLCFLDKQMEDEYRRTSWKPNRFNRDTDFRKSLVSNNLNAYLDILVSGFLLLVISLACFMHFDLTLPWVVFFVLAAIYHLILASVCFIQLLCPSRKRAVMNRVYTWGRGWVPSHILGTIMLSLPILSVLVNFSCSHLEGHGEREFYLQLVFLGIIHFCNLTALNNWVKSLTATLMGMLVILLTSTVVCPCGPTAMATKTIVNLNNKTTLGSAFVNDGQVGSRVKVVDCDQRHVLFMENVFSLLLLVALTWMLNREYEISYRLSFHCSLLSARDRKKIQNLKNQADWLLHNIIPKHVSDQLKKTMQEYSENHREVGIIFASLVNFNELYDESYMGGKEYLRVLNELISDFDEILDKPEYRNVEKIKTIGSTFMATSGINPYIRSENTHPNQHLKELMEFVLELQSSVNDFNQSLIEFDLILRIGFNCGDVTAGVIGTTKLYYDIWGDAVNIASRMESTGVEGRIQVSERAMNQLSEWYNFEKRGSIFVKGKDNMTTYLYTSRKT